VQRPLAITDLPQTLDVVAGDLARAGWSVRSGFGLEGLDWEVSAARIVCVGQIESDADAEAALLAAVRGAGVVYFDARENGEAERLIEDLGKLGPLEWRSTRPNRLDELSDEERHLLELLSQGRPLGEVARSLYVSRRTADRRLASARIKLGVRTTAEAVLLASAQVGAERR
jgi:DNA-binding CsgD family transcriptional regulator